MKIVGREKEEPEEGFEPTPWWVWGVSVAVLFAMGFYLGRYGGSFSGIAHEVEQPQLAGAQPLKREVKGDAVFAGVCQACHQSSGQGVAGQYPPLAGSEWVVLDAETPIRILLYGLEGDIRVRGVVYTNKMPAFHNRLTDDEIAAVVTYIRSSWGNTAPAVTSASVSELRAKTPLRGAWSASELEVLRKKTRS